MARKTTLETIWYIPDDLWDKIRPLLGREKKAGTVGRPPVPYRTCLDGILYVLRTGCQWEALNQTELCAKSTAHDRFQEWVDAGVFLKLWQAGVEQFDELTGIDWSWLSMDGAMTKAPLGGEKHRAQSHGPGQKWRQTQSADRGPRGTPGLGGGRGQSARHEAGQRHRGERGRQAASPHQETAARNVSGQGV